MGKPTGFMEIDRQVSRELPPEERIQNFREFHVPLHPDEQQTQGARCMDCGVPFCQSGMLLGGMYSGCPLNNLVPEWNDLVYRGQWEQAVKRLIATNRYPEFTSRVCPALCEAACTCGMATGSPVTVKENERAIVEYGYENGVLHAVPPPSRTGKKVAVVGTGPSGLSVADLLNKRGHKVTMYERSDRPGGLLMYGIPNMKLEKWVIDRRIRILKEEGIDFKGMKLVLIGTGGAATAIAVRGALDGIAQIDIFNIRDKFYARGEEIVETINQNTECKAYMHDLADLALLKAKIQEADIFCDATGVGMHPLEDLSNIPDPSYFRKDLIVTDTVYAPRETVMMKQAKEAGCERVYNGMSMMLFQALIAIKLYTGKDTPVDYMKEKLGI